MTIDWEFIETLEGRSLTGDVPDPEGSESGVTIASGVDLGQLTAAQIDGLAISDDLKTRLKPYAGLRKQQAVDFLAQHPLTITADEADALEAAVRQPIVATLSSNYNRAAGIGFDALPDAAQTVIASVAFQYGPNLQRRTPRFWSDAVRQDWTAVIEELRNFGDNFPTRRNKEAKFLEDAGLG
jgi:hypothetical protein